MSDARDLGRWLRSLDADEVAIRREGHLVMEEARRLMHQRLAAHQQRRKALLGLFAAMTAVAADETKSG